MKEIEDKKKKNGKTSIAHGLLELIWLKCPYSQSNAIPIKIPIAYFTELEETITAACKLMGMTQQRGKHS